MFEYENDTWTLEDLQQGAKDQGLEFDVYLEGMKSLGMVEKENDPSIESQTGGSEDTDFNLEDGSSESPQVEGFIGFSGGK